MRRWPRAFALVAAVVILVPAVPALGHPAEDTERQLRDANSQLEQAQAGLEVVEIRVADTQAQVRTLDGQLQEASARLATLEAQLASAQQVHVEAAARTREANRRLAAETELLERLHADLESRVDRFDRRVAATYKYGTVTYADAVVEARSFSEFLTSYYYLRSALEHEDGLIEEVSALTRQVKDRRAAVDRLRDEAAASERDAAQAAAEVEGLTREQRSLAQQVAADRAERERVLAGLEDSRSEYEALVESLEAESRKLADQLRRSRWRAGAAPGAGTLAWPTDGPPGSGFGSRTHPIFGTQRMHTGVDIAGPTGQPIVAAADGLVIGAGYRGGYGLTVVIDHGGGLATLYAHQSSLAVREGQVVSKAQTIGAIGSTGWSTGPHLHYEIRVNGEPRDPMRWY